MSQDRLDKKFDVLVENDFIELALPATIKENMFYGRRPYAIEAFSRLLFYLNDYNKRNRPTQLLFHMATGSGKTVVMAGAILELYRMGYRNFVFFVNTDTIIRKTKENFLNPNSSKYLFKSPINIEGQEVQIREVQNFESVFEDDINILFSTIQGLHARLNNPQENSITFDDFSDKEIVLLSDEAHHINTLTKKKLSGSELEMSRSWEGTVARIFEANPENIMLEFTATIELSHPNVAAKYNNKLLYDYALAQFREDGYSKEVKTNQIDFEPIHRALVGIIISQYKKKIFAHHGKLIKPVVLMKSRTTSESSEMEKAFTDIIKNLNSDKLIKIRSLQNETLQTAFKYFDELGLNDQNIIDELKDDFSEDKIISVNSKNDSDEKQIVINSLEDRDNPFRVVFAVDKLNEGWDVLNLFDIVRLYDTRDAKSGKPGKTTVQEAQLIGRGARYCPFKLSENQEADRRKFDNDLEHPMRVCETLHYHCSHNPRYIDELTNALRQIGMVANEKTEVFLELKEDFRESKFYKSGFVMINQKVENDPELLLEYQEPEIRKSFTYSLRTAESQEVLVFDENQVKEQKPNYKVNQEHSFASWEEVIFRKAMSAIPFFYFNRLKRYFPSITSVSDFISDTKYLGGIKVSVSGLKQDVNQLTRQTKLDIAKSVLLEIANEINTQFGDYRGTKSFRREPIRKIFGDKKMSFSLKGGQEETGRSTMRPGIPDKYAINLLEKDWYVYKDNFGSSEEKFFVKFIEAQMEELEVKFKNIYLLRNERFFKLYRFSDGKATEPDFVLFLTDKKTDEDVIYQLFVEPKGQHLLETDRWKENFLAEIEDEAKVEVYQNESYRLIGMPLYNEVVTKSNFQEKLESLPRD